jgi:hypothetical protein
MVSDFRSVSTVLRAIVEILLAGRTPSGKLSTEIMSQKRDERRL